MEMQILKQSIRSVLLSDTQIRMRMAIEMVVSERTIFNLANAVDNPRSNAKLLNKFYSKAIRKVMRIPDTEDLSEVVTIEEEIT